MTNTETLTTTEITKIVADYSNVIELAVLDVVQYQPSTLFQYLDDLIGDATVVVLKSLRSFQRRFLSVANVTAWIRKSARWNALNAVSHFVATGRVLKSTHLTDSRPVAVDSRKQDAARLSAALDVLTDESRTVLVALVNGEKASDVAKRMGMSNATITRRKQEAMKALTVAMAA